MKTLVVGIGSPYGDDEIAWQVIDELASSNSFSAELAFMKSKANSNEWFHDLQNYQQLIILDAVINQQSPGQVGVFAEQDLVTANNKTTLSSHGLSLAENIELARNLQILPQHLLILGITVGEKPSITDMSLDLQQMLPDIVRYIVDHISEAFNANPVANNN
ncbi:MAG: hydrogenase maturation protease [Gammaproteobacteria bacterium]|nr:hydrogenase maturation protease [Gammaproteobacteria bacterium]